MEKRTNNDASEKRKKEMCKESDVSLFKIHTFVQNLTLNGEAVGLGGILNMSIDWSNVKGTCPSPDIMPLVGRGGLVTFSPMKAETGTKRTFSFLKRHSFTKKSRSLSTMKSYRSLLYGGSVASILFTATNN
jgi:hypothetical protein